MHDVHELMLIMYAYLLLEQKKALLLEIDTLKSSLESKASTYISNTSIIVLCVYLRDTTSWRE